MDRRLQSAAILLLIAFVAAACGRADAREPVRPFPFDRLRTLNGHAGEPAFNEVLEAWRSAGVREAAASVRIPGSAPSRVSDERAFAAGEYRGKAGVLIWRGNGSEEWVEYDVDVPQDGLYEIHVSYHPLTGEGGKGPVQWSVTIDGERPFAEAASISLYRKWRDDRPIRKNADGDEVRPRSLEVAEWSREPLRDSAGAYAGPLLWRFTKGSHVIRLAGDDPVALEEIALLPPRPIPTYAEVSATYESVRPAGGGVLVLQAEDFALKNDTSIKLFADKHPATEPRYRGRIVYNTVGGLRWLEQNQEIVWSFEVPETGLYRIGFRALQNMFAQKASFRTIRIDGEVPFREFLAHPFPYAPGWQEAVLRDSEGRPYFVKLEKGRHTLSLAVTHAPVKPVIQGLERVIGHLDAVDWDLRMMTGSGQNRVTDRNRTWDMEEDFPGLTEQISLAAEALESLSWQLAAVNGRKDSVSQALAGSAGDLRALLRKPETIPYEIEQIASLREKLATFIETLMKQPLLLDEVYVIPAAAPDPKGGIGFFERVAGGIANLAYSFDARNSLRKLDDRKLNVWVQRGRDIVDLIQQMADESFTPETGIEVKVNLLSNPELLLMSNAAGVQPDVALGLTQDLPVDYAIRGAVADLSGMDGFEELHEQYSPGSWLPLYYNGGYYGVPETQSFQVLFYRKDILERLGLEVPETWEDVYELLPVLQQNAMNFYVNPKEYAIHFYQNGVEFYEPDGLKSRLDSPEAFRAFRQWTDLFNTYALEREVPSFYQHFRSGDMPIGISDYNMYVQLAAAAPELNGRWGIAELPGIRREDGTIVRWAGGGQRTAVIFARSEKQKEAWQFLKWWLSADVQAQFGNDLEAINGVAFRWNTSNVEAFVRLPWKDEDAKVILRQWKWYKDIPNVPGGYFLERELNNAWVRSVVGTMNPLESLEQAARDLNRELARKQLEFGFIDEKGNRLKPFDIPVVDRPWDGVGRYVEDRHVE